MRPRIPLSCLAALLLVSPPAAGAQAPADSPAALTLALNLPAYRLDVLDSGRLVRSYPVAIGERGYPTPTGEFGITSVEVNPRWTPPDSPWAAGKAPMPPGPSNPMRRVKMMFQPLYFVHGSPDRASIGRAASHGCVRLADADALELADLVLAAGLPAMTGPERARLLQDRSAPRNLKLARTVGISIRYELLEIAGDTVHALPDPYRLRSAAVDSVAQETLARAWKPLPLPDGTARRLLDAATERRISVPVADLTAYVWE